MNLECLVLMPMRDEVKGYERNHLFKMFKIKVAILFDICNVVLVSAVLQTA